MNTVASALCRATSRLFLVFRPRRRRSRALQRARLYTPVTHAYAPALADPSSHDEDRFAQDWRSLEKRIGVACAHDEAKDLISIESEHGVRFRKEAETLVYLRRLYLDNYPGFHETGCTGK